jgi:ribose-phosphate pyrophosphokinase
MSTLILPLPGAETLARALAAPSKLPLGSVEFRRFPDGESYYRITCEPKDADVVVVAALRDPDAQALGLWFIADELRAMGARRIGLAAPYLPYMRQDARFKPGEAITSRTFARYVSQAFDWLVTVDPHLHRYDSLDEIYTIPSTVVPAAPAIARWVSSHVKEPVLIGPDAESHQWVDEVARLVGCTSQVLTKTRHGDRHVEITLPDAAGVAGRQAVLLDDIVSSGHTMAEAARHVRALSGRGPVCIGVHALFAPEAKPLLQDAGAARVVTCNTVPDATNAIDVMPEVAAAIGKML